MQRLMGEDVNEHLAPRDLRREIVHLPEVDGGRAPILTRAQVGRTEGDGEAVFEGDRSVIEACIEWNRGSQPYAQVTDVEISWTAPRGDPKGFHVRHS